MLTVFNSIKAVISSTTAPRLLFKLVVALIATITFYSKDISAQTVLIDGWNVTYQGRNEANGKTTFSYRACPSASGAGNITSFTLGVPSCFPPFEIVNVSPTTSVTLRRDDSNGAYGILWTGLRELHVVILVTLLKEVFL
jgi:hypothetical protein